MIVLQNIEIIDFCYLTLQKDICLRVGMAAKAQRRPAQGSFIFPAHAYNPAA